MKKIVLGIVLATTCCFAAAADKYAGEIQLNKCLKKAGTMLSEIKTCYSKASDRLDKEIEAVYLKTSRQLKGDRKESHRKAQTAWGTYVSEHCDTLIDPDAGQMATLESYPCDYELKKARLAELNALFENVRE